MGVSLGLIDTIKSNCTLDGIEVGGASACFNCLGPVIAGISGSSRRSSISVHGVVVEVVVEVVVVVVEVVVVSR